MENNTLGMPENFVIIGDDAFPLSTNLMKPYIKTGLSNYERIFNYRLSRARRVVENAFGILVWRFRIFSRPIELKPDTSDKVIFARLVFTAGYERLVQTPIYPHKQLTDRISTPAILFRENGGNMWTLYNLLII